MKVTFLGQGYEPLSDKSVGNHLLNFLSQTTFHTFIGISAFASEAGVFGISGYIQNAKQNFQNLVLIVGIDQDGTSKEALEEILALDINSYIFYQTESPIFHPKIYLFEGDDDIKLIVGSSNLTGRGLFTNVESSLLIEFNKVDKEGMVLLSELKSYYKSLFEFTDSNLFKISKAVIDYFFAKGIVPDEIIRRKIYNTKKSILATTVLASNANTIIVPKRATAKLPSIFLKKPIASSLVLTPTQLKPVTAASSTTNLQPPNKGNTKILIWQKRSLSQSDAQQVPAGTAPTGNLKLSQARFAVNNITIDQTTYFRNQIFNTLTWVKTKANNNSYEEAFCPFDITILGNPIGVFPLKLSHDPVRIAGQGNTPTWLHWGNSLMPFLQQTNITGRTLTLYKINNAFFIEIA